MELVRFDPEVSRPAGGAPSGAVVGDLLGGASRATVGVLHLAAGGGTGPTAAGAARLVAVVDGEGWAAGDDGVRRPLGPGRGALWAPGEAAELGTGDGLTAVVAEGHLDVHAFRVTREIVVGPYDPAWPAWFDRIRSFVGPALAGVAVRIDHVGSTAVPGLAAKPVIDLDVVVADDGAVPAAVDRLGSLGYRWRGDLGVPGRQAFAAPAGAGLPDHHLYVVVEDNRAHQDHWLLRDLLRSDPAARDAYAALKRANAAAADRDIDAYVAAKAGLVADLLTRARAERGLPAVEYWRPGG